MPARILIIEDNPTNMELMGYLLTAFGHLPLMAYDGASGVAMARAERPDLILCDVHLPHMDGLSVVAALRADPALAAMPVLAVTALAMVGDRERLLAAGFDGYVGKPIEPDSFLAMLEPFLARPSAPAAEPMHAAPAAQAENADNALYTALQHAIEHEEFVLHYQPKVHIGSGRIHGAEALLRWQRPGHGLLAPAEFMPMLEQSGLIGVTGRWVLREACRQLAAWGNSSTGPVHLALNLSRLQLSGAELEQEVRHALHEHDVAPRLLSLEFGEADLIDLGPDAFITLRALRALGIRIALDDFGSTHAILAQLKHLPIDTIKIDIAPIRQLVASTADSAIVQAIIEVGHSMGLEVVAEGVETEVQLAFLRRHGCDALQGDVFSAPLAGKAFAQLLAAGKRLTSAPAAADAGQAPTLLVVDDDPFMREVLGDFLEDEGYRILSAANADEGFALLARHPVQLIVCDQCMPGMSGIEFMAGARQLCPDSFRVLLSGVSDLGPIVEAVNQGLIDRFYSKPWNGTELREQLREGLRLQQRRLGAGPA
ncbi:MAG: EAL domain-containing protein [Massilia sp.]